MCISHTYKFEFIYIYKLVHRYIAKEVCKLCSILYTTRGILPSRGAPLKRELHNYPYALFSFNYFFDPIVTYICLPLFSRITNTWSHTYGNIAFYNEVNCIQERCSARQTLYDVNRLKDSSRNLFFPPY